VAEATCLAFGEHFRGSAAHFTDTFHNSLYVEARRVFCGVETTPEAMGHKREQMALVPENDKVGVLSARPCGIKAPPSKRGDYQQTLEPCG
jgi:hypothetical protein